ncbi:S41 family peptidase [Fulvivirgaceae bacterium BMA10]|uniref:S41 family peptidase n=1 Tax=Splendidivirga corallicola TaxID=3051826 RepID=A0ABT8KL63_9BACT|nr:S41 family peptidase [Fulvivirgaceae bacterium BMA10]
MKKILYIKLILTLCFISCEDAFFSEDPANDPVNNFETLWNTMNDRYVFFDYKGIDWDSIYQIYRPQIQNTMTDQALFDVMEEMLGLLRDGHVNLRSGFDVSFYDGFYKGHPENFDFQLLEENYLGNYKITGSLINDIIDSVGYIRYRSFNLPIRENDLDFLVNRFKGLKGIIIDVRNNEGGDPANAYRFVERIADQRRHIYTTKYKNGPGKNDFTVSDKAFIEPTGDHPRFHQKIVLLTNRKSYSATNFFTAMLRVFPNVTVIGDQTGGGGGAPVGYELPNGWACNFSTSITYLPDGFIIEDGIPPDIRVDMSTQDKLIGKDTILERALSELD